MSGGPTDFAELITPEQAIERGDTRSLAELRGNASAKGKCIVCGAPVWRYAGQDMCFPCTTGEADASEDYELIYEGEATLKSPQK